MPGIPALLVRMRPARVGALVVALALVASSADAQPGSLNPPKWQGGANFLAAWATGEFSENIDAAAGVLIQVDRRIGESVFSLGGEFGFVVYGSQDWTSTVVGAPNLKVNLVTSNNVGLLSARLRAGRQTGKWRPDVYGAIGAHGLWTDTSIDLGASDCTALCPDVTAKRSKTPCSHTASAPA